MLLVTALLASVVSQGQTYMFTSHGDGTCTLDGYNREEGKGAPSGKFVIPDKSPSGDRVTKIASYAYYSTDITEVDIPSSVLEIGNYAFGNCFELTKLTLREGLKSVGESAFMDCALTELTLPASLATMGWASFDYQKSRGGISTLTLPAEPKFNQQTLQDALDNGASKVTKVQFVAEPAAGVEQWVKAVCPNATIVKGGQQSTTPEYVAPSADVVQQNSGTHSALRVVNGGEAGVTEAYYDLQGHRLSAPVRGVNVVVTPQKTWLKLMP